MIGGVLDEYTETSWEDSNKPEEKKKKKPRPDQRPGLIDGKTISSFFGTLRWMWREQLQNQVLNISF